VTVKGAGATFPAPLYKRWFLEYYKMHPNVRVNYQPVGSGAGIRQFTDGLLQFGASDAFMTDKEIEKVPHGVVQLPMTAGMIVLCYNVPGGPASLRLSRDTYVDIFLGHIDNWNDKAIAADNPDASLPDLPITVVRRAEGSGTTYAFTNHLTKINDKWKNGPGKGKSVVWPVGVGAKGNDGVAALIQQTPGAIGYLEFGYGKLSNLPMARLENKRGKFLEPNPSTGLEAIKMKKDDKGNPVIPKDFFIEIPDPESESAYPIVTYTWMLIKKNYSTKAKDVRAAPALRDVLIYCLTDGQKLSEEIYYLPLPEELAKEVLQKVKETFPAQEQPRTETDKGMKQP
jgi:phosphate transport system substrate-binding protein